MSLEQKVMEDLKISMKAKDSLKTETLRDIKSKMKYFQIEHKLDSLTPEDELKILRKLVKQRKDSIAEFEKANRKDLLEKEQSELKILGSYLPEEISEESLKKIIQETVQETGASEKKQMGLVIKTVMAKLKGEADGKKVSEMVQSFLK